MGGVRFPSGLEFTPGPILEHDTDQAVAIEREAICKFLYLAPEIDSEQAEALMAQIRNGEHWKQA